MSKCYFAFRLWRFAFAPTFKKRRPINSLTTRKQTTKFSSASFRKMSSPSYIVMRIQRLEGKQRRSRFYAVANSANFVSDIKELKLECQNAVFVFVVRHSKGERI